MPGNSQIIKKDGYVYNYDYLILYKTSFKYIDLFVLY